MRSPARCRSSRESQELRDLARTVIGRARQTVVGRARTSRRGRRRGRQLAGIPSGAKPRGRSGAAGARRSIRPRRAALRRGGQAICRCGADGIRTAARACSGRGHQARRDCTATQRSAGRSTVAATGAALVPGRQLWRRHHTRCASGAPAPPVAAPRRRPSRPPTPAAPSPIAADEAAIRATLREYAAAYESAERRTPCAGSIRRECGGTGEAASASSAHSRSRSAATTDHHRRRDRGSAMPVRQAFRPKVGQGRSQDVASVFRLQKTGGRWVIVERR